MDGSHGFDVGVLIDSNPHPAPSGGVGRRENLRKHLKNIHIAFILMPTRGGNGHGETRIGISTTMPRGSKKDLPGRKWDALGRAVCPSDGLCSWGNKNYVLRSRGGERAVYGLLTRLWT